LQPEVDLPLIQKVMDRHVHSEALQQAGCELLNHAHGIFSLNAQYYEVLKFDSFFNSFALSCF
jgi:hypothetical protein